MKESGVHVENDHLQTNDIWHYHSLAPNSTVKSMDIPYQYMRFSPRTVAQLDYSKITGVRGLLQNTLYLHGGYFSIFTS